MNSQTPHLLNFFGLLLLSGFFAVFCPSDIHANQKETMINIKEVLMKEHGWAPNMLGPIGQTYSISMDPSKGPIIVLHPIMEEQVSKQETTRICSIFAEGRRLMFDADVAIDYSEKKAIKARQRYMLGGGKRGHRL